MDGGTLTKNFSSNKEALVFSGLIFVLSIVSLWTAMSGAAPAALFLLILAVAFFGTLLFPRAGMLALVVCTILFQRFFTQASLVYHEVLIKLYPLDAVLGAALLVLLATLLLRRGKHLPWLSCDIWLLVFFGYVTVLLFVALWSGGMADSAIAFSTWKNYVFYGCFYFVVREIFSGVNGRFLLGKTFLLAVSAALVFLVIGLIRGEGLWTEFTPLSTAGMRILDFPHALYFCLALLSLLLLSVSERKIFGRFEKYFTFVLPILLIVGIVGSLMRHLWVALLCGLVVGFALLAPEAKLHLVRRVAVLLGMLTIVGVLGISLLTLAPNSNIAQQSFGAVSSFVTRVVSISDSGIDESVAWRGSVWQSALSSFWKSPLFGAGLGQNVPVELGDYHDFVVVRNIHNSWLALFVQTGIFGTVLFFLFFFGVIKALLHRKTLTAEDSGVRAVYGSLLIFYSVAFLFQPYLESNILATFFWILLGLIGAFVQERT